MKTKTQLLILALFSTHLHAATAPWVGGDFNMLKCTGAEQSHGGYGPYDYVTEREKALIVEQYHFPLETEQLIRPVAGYFPGDFDYTIRAIPNHHRALLSIIKYQLQLDAKIKKTHKLIRPVECYLQRAINFSSHDPVPYSLYAYYLHKKGHNEKAQSLYEKALILAPNSSKIQYSYSLFLIDEKKYDMAAEVAKKLYANDKKAPMGLKNKLIKLNAWK